LYFSIDRKVSKKNKKIFHYIQLNGKKMIWCKINRFKILAAILLFYSCLQDAPRNNPFDPGNPYTSDLPKIISIDFYSCIIYREIKNLELILDVEIDDSKYPVNLLFLDSPLLIKRITLDYITEEGKYHCKLTNEHLRIHSPDKVVGIEFQLGFIDKKNNQAILDNIEIRRIVKEEVTLINPAGGDTVISKPLLEWRSDFDDIVNVSEKKELEKIYCFYVEVLTDEMVQVWSKDSLSIYSTSIEVDNELSPGIYKWVIWIIDHFKNRSRSKIKTFMVL
jgi:hypothetical protein